MGNPRKIKRRKSKKLDPTDYMDIIEAIHKCPITYLPGILIEAIEQCRDKNVWRDESAVHQLVRKLYNEKNKT